MEILKVHESLSPQARKRLEHSLGVAALKEGAIVNCAGLTLPKGIFAHGTIVDPVAMGRHIQPRQPQNHFRNGGRENHGPRAVVLSSDLLFPTYRSILNPHSPNPEGREMVLLGARVTTKTGDPFTITSGEAVRRAVGDKSAGYVYLCCEPPECAPFKERPDYAEWRTSEEVRWDVVGRTTTDDLPGGWLIVVDTHSQQEDNEFVEHVRRSALHPIQLGEQLGVPVMYLGDFMQGFQTAAQNNTPTTNPYRI
jgi:hypothetical protein